MRKLLLPFAVMGLISFPLAGCDDDGTLIEDSGTGDPNEGDPNEGDPNEGGPGDEVDTPYYAVIVDDSEFFKNHRSGGGNPCATSASGAHGADIDAVMLSNDETGETFYLASAKAFLGEECEITFNDVTQAYGAPNGTLTKNFVSLGGGAIIGEFDGGAGIYPGDIITVYEVGDAACIDAGLTSGCVGDEDYHVYITERIDCLDASADCFEIQLTGAEGAAGEADLDVNFELEGF